MKTSVLIAILAAGSMTMSAKQLAAEDDETQYEYVDYGAEQGGEGAGHVGWRNCIEGLIMNKEQTDGLLNGSTPVESAEEVLTALEASLAEGCAYDNEPPFES